ncbi:hypothetical protein Mpsy_1334 [Methanolobus psychrophilus R15]|nr:hypothetical protein Mpsy_1334 [Methanolobus psychrophilus R15]
MTRIEKNVKTGQEPHIWSMPMLGATGYLSWRDFWGCGSWYAYSGQDVSEYTQLK